MSKTATYALIETVTLGSATASVTFNVSGTASLYTDLVLVVMAKNSASDGDLCIRFNSDTATNYSHTFMYGNGASALSVRGSNLNRMRIGRTDNTNAYPNIIQIQDYSNATTFKTAISRSQNTGLILANAGLWRNTNAITSITIIDDNGLNFTTGSTFRLYGIQAGNA
jgi:hypothetical protein